MKYTNKKIAEAIKENIFKAQVLDAHGLFAPRILLTFTANGYEYEYTFIPKNAELDETIASVFEYFNHNNATKKYFIENGLAEE